MQATFKTGYTLAFYKADVTAGDAQETWHNQPDDPIVSSLGNARLAGDLVIFPFAVGGGRGSRGGHAGRTGGAPVAAPTSQGPADEWDRYYAPSAMDPSARPVLADRLIQNQTPVGVSADGKTFYYCTTPRISSGATSGRSGRRRHAGTDHCVRGRRNIPGAARVRQSTWRR